MRFIKRKAEDIAEWLIWHTIWLYLYIHNCKYIRIDYMNGYVDVKGDKYKVSIKLSNKA